MIINDLSSLEIGEEKECYATALYVGTSSYKIAREIFPVKGVIVKTDHRIIKFFPYKQSGERSLKSTDFFGKGNYRLKTFASMEEAQKCWDNDLQKISNEFKVIQKYMASVEAKLKIKKS